MKKKLISVIWAANEGISFGYADGTFGPNKVCTKANIEVFLSR